MNYTQLNRQPKPELQETREVAQEQVDRILGRENIFLKEPLKAEPAVPKKKRKVEPIDPADVTEEHSSRIEAGEGLPAIISPDGQIFTRRTPAEHGDLIEFAQQTGEADFSAAEFESGWILDGKFVGLGNFQKSVDLGAKKAESLTPEVLAARLENNDHSRSFCF